MNERLRINKSECSAKTTELSSLWSHILIKLISPPSRRRRKNGQMNKEKNRDQSELSSYDRKESLMLWLLALTRGLDIGKIPVLGLMFCLTLAIA